MLRLLKHTHNFVTHPTENSFKAVCSGAITIIRFATPHLSWANLQLGVWPDLHGFAPARSIHTWGRSTTDLPTAGAGVNGSQRMEWETCQLQWFPTPEAEEREEKSFFNISGIQCSSHNLIRAEIISYLPPITKLTPMLTLSSSCISVSPKGEATAWEWSPWRHSHKHVQAVTCMHFWDSGLWALPKGDFLKALLQKVGIFHAICFFFFNNCDAVKRDLLSKPFHLLILLRVFLEDQDIFKSTHWGWHGWHPSAQKMKSGSAHTLPLQHSPCWIKWENLIAWRICLIVMPHLRYAK